MVICYYKLCPQIATFNHKNIMLLCNITKVLSLAEVVKPSRSQVQRHQANQLVGHSPCQRPKNGVIKSLFFNTFYLWTAVFFPPVVISYYDFLVLFAPISYVVSLLYFMCTWGRRF
jgi:hypothetical protein